MPPLHTVYDFANRPTNYTFLFIIPFVLIGLCLLYYYIKLPADSTALLKMPSRQAGIIFSAVYTGIPLLIFLGFITTNFKSNSSVSNIYGKHQYTIVQGRVTNYHPMPYGGHDTERFDVNGTHFEYMDYDLSEPGYNNAASHGGAIKANLYVRIGYYNNGQKNLILKLETE